MSSAIDFGSITFQELMERALVIPLRQTGYSDLEIVSKDDPKAPVVFTPLVEMSPGRSAARWGGGCKGWSLSYDEFLRWVLHGTVGYTDRARPFEGLIMSGGTLDRDPMITQLAPALARACRCVACSTTPRVDVMGLTADGGVLHVVPKYALGLEYRQHREVIVQSDAGTILGWDDDLHVYFDFLNTVRRELDWATGVLVANGGGVTKQEMALALLFGHPLVIVRHSLRAADEFLEWHDAGHPEKLFDDEAVASKLTDRERSLVDTVDYDRIHVADLHDGNGLTLLKAMVNAGLRELV